MKIKIGKNSKSVKIVFLKKLDRDVKRVKKDIYVKVNGSENEDFRLAGGKVMNFLESEDISAISLGNSSKLKYILEGMLLGSYRFTKYKSNPKKFPVKTIFIKNGKGVKKVVKSAEIIATATNFTKDIINSMPQEMNPQEMVKVAKTLAKTHNLKFSTLNQKQLEKEKMNAFVAVGRASSNPPALVKMVHKPKNAKKKILLIGKGLTYDSGGLSLKPAGAMTTMKSDKSGASAVIGIMKAISELNLNVEVVGYLGLAENMVGGNAYKPDDILVARNGKTIEVKNTDAEGRLVLADTLAFAQDDEVKFDYIFNIATLTGAAVVSVGEYTTLTMGHNDKLKSKLLKSGENSGELVTTLPFNRYLKKMIISPVADLSNTGSTRYGGSLTAGLFLSEFIKKKNLNKWLHLDIAGPAYVESDWGYNQYGASGAGVRMVVEFIKSLEK